MFDCFHNSLLNSLKECNDFDLRSIAQKTVKEAQYHLRYSSEWVIRLGDGTDVSHYKMQKALMDYAPYFEELFIPSDSDLLMQKEINAPDLLKLKDEAYSVFGTIVHEATLTWNKTVAPQKGGKNGIHTEHMGYILAELQYVQRTYPNLEW
jgi:ring-1,2-phenylacetyl-CoA epoxidase subunit PaaC